MQPDISHILAELIGSPVRLGHVHFASSPSPAPALALQVDFPRLEIILEGVVEESAAPALQQYDILYIAAGGWNFPHWRQPATTLSILFGKQQLGFSVLQWDGVMHRNLAKQHVARRGPRIGSFCCKRCTKCRCSRRSSRPRAWSSPVC